MGFFKEVIPNGFSHDIKGKNLVITCNFVASENDNLYGMVGDNETMVTTTTTNPEPSLYAKQLIACLERCTMVAIKECCFF